jgi:hypothetical protein
MCLGSSWPGRGASRPEGAGGPDAVLWAIPMRSEGVVIGADQPVPAATGPLAVTAGDAQVLADAVGDMLVEDPMSLATSRS